jgi:hypothetical protein
VLDETRKRLNLGEAVWRLRRSPILWRVFLYLGSARERVFFELGGSHVLSRGAPPAKPPIILIN